MELNYCFKCMEKIESYPCPKCGFDGISSLCTGDELQPGRILDGRYLIGEPIRWWWKPWMTYIGYDLSLEIKVVIIERFPECAWRDITKTDELSWNVSNEKLTEYFDSILYDVHKTEAVKNVDNIAQLYDVFFANNTMYIIMEYVEGETLIEHLRRDGPMNWSQAEKIFVPVMNALEKIHSKGILHNYISPDSIMLLPYGDIKILDLGVNKDEGLDGHLEAPLVLFFSPFSPIERYIAAEKNGPWTDVYSLAATMIYSLTGRVPPRASDRILDNDVDWEEPRLRALPTNVVDALKKALAIKQHDRFQSMAEFRKALGCNSKYDTKLKIKEKVKSIFHMTNVNRS